MFGRSRLEETAAGDPDKVGAVISQSLDVLHLVLRDTRENGVLQLDGGNDAGVRRDDVGGDALKRDPLGLETGDLLGLGGDGAVEDVVGIALDDEDLLGKSLLLLVSDLLGGLGEDRAGGGLEGGEAESLELVRISRGTVNDDGAVLINELLGGFKVLGLGAEDDDVKDLSSGGGLAFVGKVLKGEGAILGVRAADQSLALLEVSLETEGVDQELVQVDIEVQDAKSGVLVDQQIKSSSQAKSSIISLALRFGSILLNVLRELLRITGSKPSHIRLPDNTKHGVTLVTRLLLDAALVRDLSAPVDLEEDPSLVIEQLAINTDGTKTNRLRGGINLELLLPANRSAEVHLLDVNRHLSAQLADNTRGASNDTRLEEGIDCDRVDEVLRLSRRAAATALAELRLGQCVRVLLLAGVLDLGKGLELALEVEPTLGELAIPGARRLGLHGGRHDGQVDFQRSGRGVDLDETVGVRGGCAVSVGADVELVPACVGGATGELGGVERGEQLDTGVGLFAAESQGLGDVDVAQAERRLLLLGHVGDLAHGFNRHGEVASGREDGGGVELVALHPGNVLGLDDIPPIGGDTIAAVDLRAEQVVAGILAVAPLDADTGLVEDGAAVVPGVVGQVEQHLLLGLHVLARLGAVEGRVDVVDALEGDVVPVQEEVTDQVKDGGDGVLAAREGGAVVYLGLADVQLGAGLLNGKLESGVGAEFNEVRGGVLDETLDDVGEKDGGLQVGAPVGRANGMVHDGIGDGGNEADSVVGGGEVVTIESLGEEVLVLLANDSHVVRVVGLAIGLEDSGECAGLVELGTESLDALGVTGDGDTLGGVDASNTDLANEAKLADLLVGILSAETGSHHGPDHGALGNTVATVVSDDNGLLGGEVASGVGSSNFSGRVADDTLGLDAPRSEQLNQGDLDSSADRLRARGMVDHAGLGRLKNGTLESPGGSMWEHLQSSIEPLDGATEAGKLLHQLLAHLGPLSTLAGEDKSQGKLRVGLSLESNAEVLGLEVILESVLAAENVATSAEVSALDTEGVSQVGDVDILKVNCSRNVSDSALESRGVGTGEWEEQSRAGERSRHGAAVVSNRDVHLGGLENGVGIGTTISEGVDTSTAEEPSCVVRKVFRPRGRFSNDLNVPLIGLDFGVDVLDAIRGRDLALLKGHGDLDDAGKTGGSLGVTEVTLDGADQEGSTLGLLEHAGHSFDFDWVTDGGTSTVALNVVGLVEVKPGLSISLADNGLLAISTRQGDTVGLAVGVDSSTADDGADWVSVTDGIAEPLDENSADTISSAVTIGRRVKGVASGGLGQDTSFHSGELLLGRLDKVGTSHDGRVALSSNQGGNGRMQAVKRGRASSIDDKAGPLHVEHMADSVGQDGGTQTSRRVAMGVLRILELHGDKIRHEVADIATNVGIGDLIQREAGVLERLKDHLE